MAGELRCGAGIGLPDLVGRKKRPPLLGALSVVSWPLLGGLEAVQGGRATDSRTEEQRGGDVVVAALLLAHEDLDAEAGVGVDSVGDFEARDFGHREGRGDSDSVSAASEASEVFAVRREAVPLVDSGASEGADLAGGQDASTEDGVADDGSMEITIVPGKETKDDFNDNLIEFFSVDDASKIRGRKRDILFANEANELELEDWRQFVS